MAPVMKTAATGRSVERFGGLDPGEYRLAVHTGPGKYMSQWYGGLPFNGHPACESKILEAKPGLNVAEFVLEVGRNISGTVAWSGSPLYEGYAFAYPDNPDEHMRAIILSGDDHTFVIPGLCPGAYRLMFKGNFKEVFYGGNSLQDAAIVDVTQGDVSGIDADLGVLPPPTIQVTLTPTT